MDFSDSERARKDAILSSLRTYIIRNQIIPMNSPEFAGEVAGYRYFFEGEDDLLHLSVSRADEKEISVAEAQGVATFLLPDIVPGVIWVKPGEHSHHFYFGHDELLSL